MCYSKELIHGSNMGAHDQNLCGYLTDLAVNYLDWLDQKKETKLQANQRKIKQMGLNHQLDGRDDSKYIVHYSKGIKTTS